MIEIKISGDSAAEVAASVLDLADLLRESVSPPSSRVLEIADVDGVISLRSPDRDDERVAAVIEHLREDLAAMRASPAALGRLEAFVRSNAGPIRSAGFAAVVIDERGSRARIDLRSE